MVKIQVDSSGQCEASGYTIMDMGKKKFLQVGTFCTKLEHPQTVQVGMDTSWQQRVTSTQLAAAERMIRHAVPRIQDIFQRRAALR